MQVFNRWEEVERLFHAALEQDPAHRTEFLSKICSDPDLLAEVNSLLEAHEKGSSVLDQPPHRVAAEFLEELDSRQDSLVGSSFDHYEITGVLGEGGMGKVYLAQDTRLMRKVALKLLPAPHVQSIERLRRFAQEARVASALNHPNIITVYDYGQAASSYYIATEYIEGKTLRALIRDGIALRAALEIGMQMASAFAAAHRAGIIHRDIKPENIMVRADGLVKVLDFGLAKLAPQSDPTTSLGESPATVPGAVIGTFCYMSPEQARGQELDARTDIFSFGIVLYEMLAGRRPFEGETLPDLLSSLVGSDPPPLSDFLRGAPPETEEIVACALARDRDRRYQSFDDLLGDLNAVSAHLDAANGIMSDREREASRPEQERPSHRNISLPRGLSREGAIKRTPKIGVIDAVSRGARFLYVGMAVVLAVVSLVFYKPISKLLHITRIEGLQFSQPRRITDDGKASVNGIAVTRDGERFAYVGRAGLSVLATPSSDQDPSTEILHADCHDCKGVTFSPDGDYLYYVVADDARGTSNLYRRAVSTNFEEKIKGDVNRSISFSPDGKRFAFVRNRERALMVADANGPGEDRLTSLDGNDDLWVYPAWSPDGRTIACSVMKQNGSYHQIYAVDAQDGSKRVVGFVKWSGILNLAWVADSSRLIVNASDEPGHPFGLWQVSYPDGDAIRITNDASTYYGLALSSDSRTLLSVRGDVSASLHLFDRTDPSAVKKVNLGLVTRSGLTGVCWTPSGGVVCSAGPRESTQLYFVDPAQQNRIEPRKLTTGTGVNNWPCVTSDGRYIVFASDRGGSLCIWRVDIGGGNSIPLTAEGLNPSLSPDGKWVVYQIATKEHTRLWKVSIDGGDSSPLTEPNVDAENPAVSPDGKRIACLMGTGDKGPQIGVISLDNGVPPDLFPLPVVKQPIIRWRDNQALAYIDQRGEGSDVWIQKLDRSNGLQQPTPLFGPNPHPLFSIIFNFDWARKGQVILSAGDNSRDVVKLTLVK